jgi:hypothetical protein
MLSNKKYLCMIPDSHIISNIEQGTPIYDLRII